MARTVLEVRELWVGEGPEFPCRGVDLVAFAGEILCVLGTEGAGKSQLFRCIGLDFHPSRGSILLNGADVTDCDRERRRQLRSRSIELVHPPAPDGAPDLTVPKARAGVLLSSARHSTVPVAGMRQRIQIAKALTQGADLLLLDEPFVGVDPQVQARILELLARLRTEKTTAIVMATRDSELARQLADRVLVLEEGAVIEQGSAEQVLDHPNHPRTKELVSQRRSA